MTRSSQAPSAYDEDFFTWTQDQAAALRRAGAYADIDVAHVAEEIEDLGKRDLREVESFLRLLLFHLLKVATSPEAPSVLHWKAEAREFQASASRGFSPGMRQHLDEALLWRQALKRLIGERHDLRLPPLGFFECPYTLDDLLTEEFDLDRAISRLGSSASLGRTA